MVREPLQVKTTGLVTVRRPTVTKTSDLVTLRRAANKRSEHSVKETRATFSVRRRSLHVITGLLRVNVGLVSVINHIVDERPGAIGFAVAVLCSIVRLATLEMVVAGRSIERVVFSVRLASRSVALASVDANGECHGAG